MGQISVNRIFFDSPGKNTLKNLRVTIEEVSGIVEIMATDLVDISDLECTGKFTINNVDYTFTAIASDVEIGSKVSDAFNSTGLISPDTGKCTLDIKFDDEVNLYSFRWEQVETTQQQVNCVNIALFNSEGMIYKMLEIAKYGYSHDLLVNRKINKKLLINRLFIRPKVLGSNSTHIAGGFYMNYLTFFQDNEAFIWGPELLVNANTYKSSIHLNNKTYGVTINTKYPLGGTTYPLNKINDKTAASTETGFFFSSMKTTTKGYGVEILFDKPLYLDKVLFHVYSGTTVLNGNDWELFANDLEEPIITNIKNQVGGVVEIPIQKRIFILHHPVTNAHYTIKKDSISYLDEELRFGTDLKTTNLGSISDYNMSQGMTQSRATEFYSKNVLLKDKVYILGKGFQEFIIPESGTWEFKVQGADGGYAGEANSTVPWYRLGGRGACIEGKITLNKGDNLLLIIGQSGWSNSTGDYGAGGGGLSGILKEDPSGTLTFETKYIPLVVAGAGAGRCDERRDNTNDIRNDDNALNAKYLTSSLITDTGNGADSSAIGGAGIVTALAQTRISSADTTPHYGGFPGGGSSYNGGGGGSGYHGGNASDTYPSYGGTSFWHPDLVADPISSLREYSVEPPRHGYIILTYRGNV